VTSAASRPTAVALWPTIDLALARARAARSVDFEVFGTPESTGPQLHAKADDLEEALYSLLLMASDALGGHAGSVAMTVSETLLEEVVLDQDASTLQGGLPPRSHVRIHIASKAATGFQASPSQWDLSSYGNVESSRHGLAEVRDMIEANHGSVNFQSRYGKGTWFEIYMPTVSSVLAQSPDHGSMLGPRHVLYVDDYEPMCDLANEVLTDAGYRVTCFDDSARALAEVMHSPGGFDIAVIDFNMPRPSGLEMAEQLRLLNPGLPVIMISGYVDDGMQKKVRRAGVRALVSKSNSLDDLCVLIRQVLGQAPPP
jgi:CheY-like chemotaxis protein